MIRQPAAVATRLAAARRAGWERGSELEPSEVRVRPKDLGSGVPVSNRSGEPQPDPPAPNSGTVSIGPHRWKVREEGFDSGVHERCRMTSGKGDWSSSPVWRASSLVWRVSSPVPYAGLSFWSWSQAGRLPVPWQLQSGVELPSWCPRSSSARSFGDGSSLGFITTGGIYTTPSPSL